MAGTLENPVIGEKNSTGDPKIVALVKLFNERLNSENQLGNTLRWYTPKSIATEQTRESATFGTLTTADEVKEVVLPENGLISIGYDCTFKSSVSAAGRAAIFIGANQLKADNTVTAPEVQEATSFQTKFAHLTTRATGLLTSGSEWTGNVTTGQALATAGASGGLCYVFAAAGTYNISVQFKATSGSVTAKERKLWVATLGA